MLAVDKRFNHSKAFVHAILSRLLTSAELSTGALTSTWSFPK